MLVAKKMSSKKTAVYFCLIVLMMFLTAWVIYGNRKSSAPTPTSLLGVPQIDQSATSAVDMAKIESGGDFDLSIFNSEKFKQLRENIIAPESQPTTGKRDPFKPN